MSLVPKTMLEATVITPLEDFPKLIVVLAESEKFMPREILSIEDLDNYYSPKKIDSVRHLETSYEDLIKLIPEPKEKLFQKLARAFRKQPTINPLFQNWEDIDEIETKLREEIRQLEDTLQNLKDQSEKKAEAKEINEMIEKGFRLIEEEFPYDIKENERTLIGVLTTSKIEDAEEFVSEIKKSEVIPLIQNKFLIFAQDKKAEISKLIKSLTTVRWFEHQHEGPIHLSKLEISDEIIIKQTELEHELKNLEDELNKFAIKNKEIIMSLRLTIESFSQFLRIYISAKRTKKTAIIQGWIAQRDKKTIENHIANFRETVIVFNKPQEELKNIPIVPSKNVIVRAFQSIIGLYGLPSSKEIDPTIFVIFTFSIFFGIMFGDAGHGLIFITIGLLGILAKGLKRSVRQMFLLVFAVGFSSFIMGAFIFGEAFGKELAEIFGIHNLFGREYPILHPIENLTQLFNLTLIIGSIHITLGLILRMINQIRHREWEELLKETWAQIFLYAAILYFLSSLGIINFGIPSERLAIVGLISVSIGVGLALLGQGIASIIIKEKRQNILRNFLGGIGMGLMNLLESFSSFISNTISYGRILAMLIAHVVFLSVINELASLSGFIIWQILILVIGNIFVIILEGLLVFVQTLRLHFYEFFSKFYEGSGIEHKPIFVFNKQMELNKYG